VWETQVEEQLAVLHFRVYRLVLEEEAGMVLE
jgi:hypothetical protein